MTRHSNPSSHLLIASLCLLLVVASNSQSFRNNKLSLNSRLRILQTHHDDKHVDADDHKHALELHACEGTELELHGDAVLHAENVDNVKQFLVTNEELTTCDEIEQLRCKPGASFCKTWSASNNQNVELKANMFKDKKAHFYAQAQDKAYVMSLVINLHPEGYQDPSATQHHSGHKEEHVHDDSEYHSLDLEPCSGVTLELPEGHDALFDASAVTNVKRFLVTDMELDSCEDIKHMKCKSGNQFCYNWDAHANEMIVLEKDKFPKHEAFFYVQRNNEDAHASVNVKTVPATQDANGDWHALNDNHVEKGHETGKHGSHEEKHMEADGHIHAVELKACTGTTIELAGDAVVSTHTVFNAKRFMITNLEMQSCEQIAAFECQKDATFCHIWDAKTDQSVKLKFGLFSAHEAFFYADPIDSKQEVSLNLKVLPEGKQEHEAHGDGVAGSHMTTDTHTHALELRECSVTTFDLKGDTVLEVENVSNAKAYMITDVPLETCEEIIAWKCPSNVNLCHVWDAAYPEDVLMEIADFPKKEAYFYVQPKDAKESIAVNAKLETLGEYNPNVHHKNNLHNIHEDIINHVLRNTVYYGVLSVLLLIFISSYCYRRYLTKYNRPPFNAPSWVPSFIFPPYDPEAHGTFITSQNQKQEVHELNSGIIKQVDV